MRWILIILLSLSVAVQAETLNLNYQDADLAPTLRQLARRAGENLYVSPEVSGMVTVRAKNQSFNQALALILSLQVERYGFKRVGNITVVAPPEKLDQIASDLLNMNN